MTFPGSGSHHLASGVNRIQLSDSFIPLIALPYDNRRSTLRSINAAVTELLRRPPAFTLNRRMSPAAECLARVEFPTLSKRQCPPIRFVCLLFVELTGLADHFANRDLFEVFPLLAGECVRFRDPAADALSPFNVWPRVQFRDMPRCLFQCDKFLQCRGKGSGLRSPATTLHRGYQIVIRRTPKFHIEFHLPGIAGREKQF